MIIGTRILYLRYKTLAKQISDVVFGGCLTEHKYYDMAPAIGAIF